jgi:hypothetical protein
MDALMPAIPDAAFSALGMASKDAEAVNVPFPDTTSIEALMASAPFADAEKPLQYEICTNGWIPARERGVNQMNGPLEAVMTDRTIPQQNNPDAVWDNIHLWPGKRLNGNYVPPLPSAPGAFHALHCHWRWGASLGEYWYLYNNSDVTRLLTILSAANPNLPGGKTRTVGLKFLYVWFMKEYFGLINPANTHAEYQGVTTQDTVSLNMGGPLFDPQIPDQAVSFAVALRDHADLSDDVSFDFGEHFRAGKSAKPADIRDGAELSWWMSFAPHRRISATTKPVFVGTIFPHGTHFAHNLREPTSIFGRDGNLSSLTHGKGTSGRPAVQEWER